MQAYSLYRIMLDARQLTRPVALSLAEMLFVCSHAALTECEKIIWLLLAAHAEPESFSCTFSYAQLSHCTQQPHDNVHRALQRLIAMGFLESKDLLTQFSPLLLLRECQFSVQLPLEGLLALKKTPRIKKPEAWHEKGIYKRPPILINLLRNRLP